MTVHVYRAQEGGSWAEMPEYPGCYTQVETMDELKESAVRPSSATSMRGYAYRCNHRKEVPPGPFMLNRDRRRRASRHP